MLYVGWTDRNGAAGDQGYVHLLPVWDIADVHIEKMNPDRIIIESRYTHFVASLAPSYSFPFERSGSAFPATLAIQIRQLAPQGFSLDSVVTVIDCVNFTGYEDSSPTAKVRALRPTLPEEPNPFRHDSLYGSLRSPQIQAKYTDCLILNKHDLVTERQLDTVLDHLYELNDETPVVRVSAANPLTPELVFGLDTKLFTRGTEEAADWEATGQGERHMDEVESRSVWRGGGKPGKGGKRDASQVEEKAVQPHRHVNGEACGCDEDEHVEEDVPIQLVDEEVLQAELAKLPFEIYRGT